MPTPEEPKKPNTSDIASLAEAMEHQSEVFIEQSEATKDAIIKATTEENAIFKKRNRLLIWMLAVLILITGIGQYRSFFVTGPILDKLKTNQSGIDSLVEFVEGVKAQSCDRANPPKGGCPPSQSEALVANLVRIMCAIDDPKVQATCKEIGFSG